MKTQKTSTPPPVGSSALLGRCPCGAHDGPDKAASHCWWCGKKFISSSDPSVDTVPCGGTKAEKGRDTMIPVHDLISRKLGNEDHRGMNATCPLYEIPGTKETVSSTPIFDSREDVLEAFKMCFSDHVYAKLRVWMEESEAAGHWLPKPREVTDYLNGVPIEVINPLGSEYHAVNAAERPSVTLDQRRKPSIKDRIWHLWEKGSGVFRWGKKHGATGCPNDSAHPPNP